MPPLPLNILQAEQIVGGQFCDWVGITVLTLEALSGYRREPVQALYTPLLEVLTRAILVGSRDFPVYCVFTLLL